MGNLSWFQIALAVYLSLWVFKLILVFKDFPLIINMRIVYGTLKVPDGHSTKGYVRRTSIIYCLGASVALLIVLLPTLLKEGFAFFKSYPVEELAHFAKHNKWES